MGEARDDLGRDVGLDGWPGFGGRGRGGREEGREIAWLDGRKDREGGQGGVVGYDWEGGKCGSVKNQWVGVPGTDERTLFDRSMCCFAELVGVHACGSGLQLGWG